MFKTTLTAAIFFLSIYHYSSALALTGSNVPDKKNPSRSKRDSLSMNNTINKNFLIHVKKRTGEIKLDGKIDEEDWLKAEKATNFYMVPSL